MTDANAEVGSWPSAHIGPHQQGRHDTKSEPFLDFVVNHQLFLPATFQEWQFGAGETWTHSRGHRRRIDYVGLPMAWMSLRGVAWVQDDFETALAKDDHFPVCVDATFEVPQRAIELPSKSPFSSGRLDLHLLPENWWPDLPRVQWDLDVHSHAHSLQAQLITAIVQQPKQPRLRPVKTTLTESTWQLVLEKKATRRALHDLNAIQAKMILEACFSAWARRQVPDLAKAQAQLDHATANTLWHFRSLGRQVTAAVRQDDRAFFGCLLAEGAELLEPHQVKQFWAVVRRSIPKFQQRRRGFKPLQMEALAPHWGSHFCELEVGTVTTSHEHWQHCCARQEAKVGMRDMSLFDLPSANIWEDAVRETQPGKSTGLDPLPSRIFRQHAPFLSDHSYSLILKMNIHGVEPIQFKGGPMALIHKSGALDNIVNYRGILLLPSLAKRVHAVLRRQLMSYVAPKRPSGQLGGFPCQQVAFGSHAARTASRIFDVMGLSSFTLFLDLRNAFHRLTRELVLGLDRPDDFLQVVQALQSTSTALSEDAKTLARDGILADYGCPAPLRRLLSDVHSDTWCAVANGVLLHTRRGTRPGSPLADLIFHILTQKVATELEQWVRDEGVFAALLEDLGLGVPILIWSDDLSITWATREGAALLPALDALIIFIHGLFGSLGFEVNFALGKTNAVVTFRGTGAADLRRTWTLVPSPGRKILLPTGEPLFMHFVHQYKHLGTYFTEAHTLDVEVSTRIGIASAAFAKLARPLLCNRRLPLNRRLQLFQALISSKLFFGLGAWQLPGTQLLKKLDAVYVRFLRRILGLQRDDHFIPTAQVLVQANTLGVRARLALDRLLYARKLFQVGPALLQMMLHVEDACTNNSWIAGLRKDLEWFDFLLPDVLPQPFDSDLTEVIDFWQNPSTPWKRYVHQARRRALLQDAMMTDVQHLHKQIVDVLRGVGATFKPDIHEVLDLDPTFDCPSCSRSFGTAQGLASHRRIAHGYKAAEYPFNCCWCNLSFMLEVFVDIKPLGYALGITDEVTNVSRNSCNEAFQMHTNIMTCRLLLEEPTVEKHYRHLAHFPDKPLCVRGVFFIIGLRSSVAVWTRWGPSLFHPMKRTCMWR